jgi:50S ribosomal subunit-associated GTPase HflX
VSLASADAFVIVFSLDSSESWEEVSRLRDMVHDAKDPEVPIVIVGNKSDLPCDDAIPHESLEATVVFDWENGYVECSAKDRVNINKIFKELLQQAKSRYDFTTHCNHGPGSSPISIVGTFSRNGSQKAHIKSEFEEHMRRRQSLPAAPPDLPPPAMSASIPKRDRSFKAMKSRRASLAALRRDSCKVS